MKKVLIFIFYLFSLSISGQGLGTRIIIPQALPSYSPFKSVVLPSPNDSNLIKVVKNGKTNVIYKNQKIVFVGPKIQDKKIFIDSLLNKLSRVLNTTIRIKKQCNCNDGLFLLEGENLHTVEITPDPDGAGGSNNDNIYPPQSVSLENLNKIHKENNQNFTTTPIQSDCTSPPTKIAIIDSGIDFKYFETKDELFLKNGNYIFVKDFTNSNLPHEDGLESKHGSMVTSILTKELDNRNVKLLPLKVFNNKSGNLFDALCALLYAQKQKVDIINISWHHIGNMNSVFAMIVESLREQGVIIVCSAGNSPESYGDLRDDNIQVSSSKRNSDLLSNDVQKIYSSLDTYSTYPACFSYRFENVISVTSTYSNYVVEDYSGDKINGRRFVDIGVEQDSSSGFYVPFSNTKILGSSFASAYFSSYLGKDFELLRLEWSANNAIRANITPSSGPPTMGSIFTSSRPFLKFKDYVINKVNYYPTPPSLLNYDAYGVKVSEGIRSQKTYKR